MNNFIDLFFNLLIGSTGYLLEPLIRILIPMSFSVFALFILVRLLKGKI